VTIGELAKGKGAFYVICVIVYVTICPVSNLKSIFRRRGQEYAADEIKTNNLSYD
jgi:hypothetical protein